MAAEMDMEFDAALAAAAAPVTGEENATADSRWSSTSSAESELNNFWVRIARSGFAMNYIQVANSSHSTIRYVGV